MSERARSYVAVAGASAATADEERVAEELGRLLAGRGAVVVTGGLGGVMAAACRGAKAAGGTTLGLLPGDCHADTDAWVDVAASRGLGAV